MLWMACPARALECGLVPLFIRVHDRDNVAIIVASEGAAPGVDAASGFTVRDRIPQSHKVALSAIQTGEPVIRYGQTIGLANRSVAAGEWVREDDLSLPAAPALDQMALATAVPKPLPALEGFTFEGFKNADGSVGTRNILGITTTVQCVAPTVDYAARRINAELLPRFPNVDDVVAVTHGYGCGIAINAPGAAVPISTLKYISTHANFAAHPLVVSLGCEKLQPTRLFESILPMLAQESNVVRLQDERGFAASVSAIMEAAEKRLAELNRRHRETVPAAHLSVGLQCGGSDAFSGVTCNPAVGFAADLLVRAGASVFFSEVTEVRDAIHLLTPRASQLPMSAANFWRRCAGMTNISRAAEQTEARIPRPATNAVVWRILSRKRWAQSPRRERRAIMDVASQGQKVNSKGLVFAATPASDFICGTQQLASMNLHVFTTGEGSPYSLSLVPVVKVSSRTALAEKWHDLIDIDAGRIATGDATIEQVGWELFHFMLDVASGRKKTWGEHWGLGNALVPFNPGPIT